MEMKLTKAKLEFYSFCGGLGSKDVGQGLLSLTFRNQVVLKLVWYKNLEIPAYQAPTW